MRVLGIDTDPDCHALDADLDPAKMMRIRPYPDPDPQHWNLQ